jgi:hypothetical protein
MQPTVTESCQNGVAIFRQPGHRRCGTAVSLSPAETGIHKSNTTTVQLRYLPASMERETLSKDYNFLEIICMSIDFENTLAGSPILID